MRFRKQTILEDRLRRRRKSPDLKTFVNVAQSQGFAICM
uniref:Uncharacterized protein n=1 Tax=Anguilla anguilla TaxID=7936 RepID=A0A0E9VSB7_ANGAN